MGVYSTSRLCGPALLALLAWSTLQGQVATVQATFRASAQLVLVPVTVTDHNGKTIEGLRAEDFDVLDDQASQKIISFAREDVPCSIGLVLDVSGSMRNVLGSAKDVVRTFLKSSNPDDEFRLMTVSTQPEETGFTTDTEALEASVASARPGGLTALIDTVYLGLNRMRKARHPQRALLILSDGMDNHSQYSKHELMRVALEADVQVYTIIVNGLVGGSSANGVPFRPSMVAKPGDRAAENQGPAMLEELSEKTGGLHFRVRNDSEAIEAAAKAGQALRNQYVIGYQPPDSRTSGKWHRVRVKTNVPKLTVYARNGYYAH